MAAVDLDPWGGETGRSWNGALQPRKYTTYERDGNGSDEAMMRRYNRWHSRFDQPDPYRGSYQLTNPQSLNRYAYTHGDPVNFADPAGLDLIDIGSFDFGTVYGSLFGPFGAGGGALRGKPDPEIAVNVGTETGGETTQTPKNPCDISDLAVPPGADVNKNINEAAWQYSMAMANASISGDLSGATYGIAIWFKEKVRNAKGRVNDVRSGQSWDYKQLGSQYKEFGNFNYGAAGLAAGVFGEETLLTEAGKAQIAAGTSRPEWGTPDKGPPYGDDPEDQKLIKRGFAYYNAGCYKR